MRCAEGQEAIDPGTILGLTHWRGTGVPHSRQLAALKWTGFLQRGQTRKPVSNLATEGRGMTGAITPTSASEPVPGTIAAKPVVEPGL